MVCQLVEGVVRFDRWMMLRGLAVTLTDVTFLKDFGPWLEGEQVDRLTVDLAVAVVSDGRRQSDVRLMQKW